MKKEERIALLCEVLSIPSDGKNEKAVADCLGKHFADHDISARELAYAPDRSNLIAQIGVGNHVLALSGHLDVVPAGDLKSWKSPPYAPELRDGKLYARGATDMKSGLVAMAIAMIELAKDKTMLDCCIRFLGTVGEETGLLGAQQLTDAGYAKDIEALIIGEPTGRRIVYAHKGICTITIHSHGKNAHSSMPEQGVNAIDNLILFYNRILPALSKLNRENAALGKLSFCNSVIRGGEQFNMVPAKASLTTNLRTIPEIENEEIISLFYDTMTDMNRTIPCMWLEMDLKQSDPPVFSDPSSKLVQTARAEAKKMFGLEIPIIGAPGATDAAKFIQGNKRMQVVVFGPGSETMHQVNEYVKIDDYLDMIDLYKNIIRAYFFEKP